MRDAIKPVVVLAQSNAQVFDQGITYNEPGLTYNQIGIGYGGLYEFDIVPIIARSIQFKPMGNVYSLQPNIVFGMDYSGTAEQHGTIVLGRGMLIGILGMTYPTSGTIVF